MKNFDKTTDSAWCCLPGGWKQNELLPNCSSALLLLSIIQISFWTPNNSNRAHSPGLPLHRSSSLDLYNGGFLGPWRWLASDSNMFITRHVGPSVATTGERGKGRGATVRGLPRGCVTRPCPGAYFARTNCRSPRASPRGLPQRRLLSQVFKVQFGHIIITLRDNLHAATLALFVNW